jgi:penicillin-binding protein 2
MLGGFQALLSTALIGRLYYLGVIESGQYKTLAEENRVSLRFLTPERGDILDRAGRLLATNRRDYRIFLVPEQTSDPEATLKSLGQMIALSDNETRRLLERIHRQRSFQPVSVAENLDWETFARVNVASIKLAGVQPDAGQTRFYPEGRATSHVVGYVGPITEEDIGDDPILHIPGVKIGRAGLEDTFDLALRGQAGTSRFEVNAYGRVVRELTRQEGEVGQTLTLTIDLELQKFVTERLAEKSAAAIVMDVNNGDILVQASTPSFDSNQFNLGFSHKDWDTLVKDPRKPLINKCLAGQYPPGSTFKMIVALAALEAGVVNSSETILCTGERKLGDRIFHCWKEEGHGRLSMSDAIGQSCDIYFYEIARRTGIEKIAEMARRFGFGKEHSISVGSQAKGLVPDRGWKMANYGERWQIGETLITGIGQGALLSTPLQLALMTAQIANGGKQIAPRLVQALGVKSLPPVKGSEIGINRRHLNLVKTGMIKTMRAGGTAYGSRFLDRQDQIAGKTGTSQVRRITAAEREAGSEALKLRPWKERDHALFVGYVPLEAPKYAVAVVVEHGGGGSSVAAPIARDILKRALELDPVGSVAGRKASRNHEEPRDRKG